MNIERIEEMLKTLTVKQIADRLDITKDSLQYHLKMAGTDVLQVKDDYAREVLTPMSGKYSFSEMAALADFSLRKVKKYAALLDLKSNANYTDKTKLPTWVK